jgi:predicted nucleic acid-binding protein
MKAYIDNSVISALAKGEFPAETSAFEELLARFEASQIELVTSELTAKEIEPYVGNSKENMRATFTRLLSVGFIEDHRVVGFHSQWSSMGGAANPLVEDDLISHALRKILPVKKKNRVDAHHLMLAIRAACDVFLTCDKRTILKVGPEIETQFPIKLMSPKVFLDALIANCSPQPN